MTRRWIRLLTLWFLLGSAYYQIEIVYRMITDGGGTHLVMWIIGGLCGVAVGSINQIPRFYRMPIWAQSLIGTVITLAVELAAGCVLNLRLGLGIWDYSELPFNFMGQICLPFALAWYAIMPFAIWLEDQLRWGYGWDGKDYSLGSIYLDLLMGR